MLIAQPNPRHVTAAVLGDSIGFLDPTSPPLRLPPRWTGDVTAAKAIASRTVDAPAKPAEDAIPPAKTAAQLIDELVQRVADDKRTLFNDAGEFVPDACGEYVFESSSGQREVVRVFPARFVESSRPLTTRTGLQLLALDPRCTTDGIAACLEQPEPHVDDRIFSGGKFTWSQF